MANVTRKQKNSDATEHDTQAPNEQDSRNGCCGGPASPGVDACCARDEAVKSAGGTGCGCAAPCAKETGADA